MIILGQEVIKLSARPEDFGGAVCSKTLSDKFPQEVRDLKDGYYQTEGKYFRIETSKYVKNTYRSFVTPWRQKDTSIEKYVDSLEEREYQENLGEVLAEITMFNNDLHTDLVFVDGVAKLKPYYNKELAIKDLSHNYNADPNSGVVFGLFVDNKEYEEIEIFTDDNNKYSCYDGVEGYGWHKTIKEAVKRYMDSRYKYKGDTEYYEPSCSSCGDGGCIHCEPHRFI